MQLIWQQRGQLKVVDFTQRGPQLALVVLIALLAAALLSLGSTAARLDAGMVKTEQLALAEQRYQRAEAQLASQKDQVRAFAARLSRMQAHIIRLDALGRQLTSMADLDPADFAFEQPPAQGGRAPASEYSSPELVELGETVAAVASTIENRRLAIERLAELLLNRQLQAQVRPDGHPVTSGYISSYFGKRTDPFTGHSMTHKGIDYAGPPGTKVVAVADGVVSESKYFGGFGNFVEITHGQGFVTRYAHNQKNLVQAGQRVQRGQPVALLGSTGRATGPNLHFEVLRSGEVVDPMNFIESDARDQ